MPKLTWRKSSHSDDYQGACVEVAEVTAGVAIRDSKDPDGPVLVVSHAALRIAIRSADE
ncbi:hypothetical protein GCM10022254_01020 [Actinomadura meridiana]|uniref:DUF397 domain-containing protein n=1 Tax=Actinomadura meridiana TaxID=559626 RepID=A0ABP8BRP4_9ACTN